MIIHCRGGDTEIKRLTREVAEFCASNLMSKRLANSVEVWFHFKHIEGTNYGDCIWEDDDYRPRLFTMDIHWDKDPTKRDYGKVLKTVCHEMVHVKQWAKGEMKQMYRPYGFTKFLGEYYPDTMNYWDTPWEIEAYGREVGLYTRWLDTTKRTGDPKFDSRIEDVDLEDLLLDISNN